MTVKCEECGREVPVAPGYFKVSVPHVGCSLLDKLQGTSRPCNGNVKRSWRDDGLVHGAVRLAQQYAILDDDAYWEGL